MPSLCNVMCVYSAAQKEIKLKLKGHVKFMFSMANKKKIFN